MILIYDDVEKCIYVCILLQIRSWIESRYVASDCCTLTSDRHR